MGVKSGEQYDAAMPERMQLLLGRIHRDWSSPPSLSLNSDTILTALLSHRMFLRAEEYAERSGELLLNILFSIFTAAPSSTLSPPIELLVKEQRVKEELVCTMCTNEPLHAHDGYFASSGVDREASEVLSVPVKAESLKPTEKEPVSEMNLPCVDAAGAVCAGVLVRLANVQSDNVNVNEETLLVRERNTGCALSQWMSVHVSEDSERDDGVDEERDVWIDATNAEEDERVMS